jgi:hypothetical protein
MAPFTKDPFIMSPCRAQANPAANNTRSMGLFSFPSERSLAYPRNAMLRAACRFASATWWQFMNGQAKTAMVPRRASNARRAARSHQDLGSLSGHEPVVVQEMEELAGFYFVAEIQADSRPFDVAPAGAGRPDHWTARQPRPS